MKKIKYAALVIVVIIIGLLHFFTPGHLFFYHDTFRRLSYFPIVLAAIWFGVRGGLSIAVMSSIFFIPHILLYLGQGPSSYLSELMEIILYLAAGTVTGIIVSREAMLRERYKQLSEKLQNSYDRLHEESRLLLELEEQLSASQKLSALGQLSASLAHEIKNPLSSIKGTAEILLDEFPPGHAKREFVEILLKETSRLNTTVDEVLHFSKNSNPGQEAAMKPLSVVIDQVAKLLAGQIRKKSITLAIRGRDDFMVDSGKLSQVFLNIILNSIDAVPRQGEIVVETVKRENGISVSIADNGPGVPPEMRDTIFMPFYSDKDDGTGLGLSISRKIVESYDGKLTVSQAPSGNGACFTVFLPGKEHYGVSPLPETAEKLS